MKHLLLFVIIIVLAQSVFAQKTVYVPKFLTSDGVDLTKSSSQYCYDRSKETENVVVFWEAGFGSDPSTATGSYKVNIASLLAVAEKSYALYIDSLQFAIRGSSVTDKYKLMIFLLYSTEWAAYGSGQDDMVGTLHVNPAAANNPVVVAHETGHCFQYITGCDGNGGYQYGFGPNTAGGNGFWEQCANWMAYKVYPEKQFTEGDFAEYIKNNHLHIIHEAPRYANYFLMDYWTYKHDLGFVGKLWRDSRSPEDPVETYKRLTTLSQSQFNDEMYEHASRLTTWDLPAIKSYGQNYIDRRTQVKMSLTTDKYWRVDPSVCIENYGYNSIKLNAPPQATDVRVNFKGLAGTSGFRALDVNKGGWRFGFVALLKDGARKYSDIVAVNMNNSNNPDTSFTFGCPANCSKLWLIVSGAPQEHWRHAWDDNNTNDEQWPYQVQFVNTNLDGQITGTAHSVAGKDRKQNYPVSLSGSIVLPVRSTWRLTNLAGKQIASGYGNLIATEAFSSGGYILLLAGRSFKILKQ